MAKQAFYAISDTLTMPFTVKGAGLIYGEKMFTAQLGVMDYVFNQKVISSWSEDNGDMAAVLVSLHGSLALCVLADKDRTEVRVIDLRKLSADALKGFFEGSKIATVDDARKKVTDATVRTFSRPSSKDDFKETAKNEAPSLDLSQS